MTYYRSLKTGAPQRDGSFPLVTRGYPNASSSLDLKFRRQFTTETTQLDRIERGAVCRVRHE